MKKKIKYRTGHDRIIDKFTVLFVSETIPVKSRTHDAFADAITHMMWDIQKRDLDIIGKYTWTVSCMMQAA